MKSLVKTSVGIPSFNKETKLKLGDRILCSLEESLTSWTVKDISSPEINEHRFTYGNFILKLYALKSGIKIAFSVFSLGIVPTVGFIRQDLSLTYNGNNVNLSWSERYRLNKWYKKYLGTNDAFNLKQALDEVDEIIQG